jgi:hypothetical protein
MLLIMNTNTALLMFAVIAALGLVTATLVVPRDMHLQGNSAVTLVSNARI